MDGTWITRKLAEFGYRATGTVGVLFGLAVIPVVLVLGSAADMVSANNMRTRMQAAVDAAALTAAAAGGLTAAEREDLAIKAFHQNFAGGLADGVTATPAFTITDSSVSGTATAELDTLFMRIAAINSLDISTGVTISIPQSKKIEVALVLDYSGSMKEIADGEVKYQAMAAARRPGWCRISPRAAKPASALCPFLTTSTCRCPTNT